MTTTSPPDTASAAPPETPPRRRRAGGPLGVAVVAALVALVCTALMPLLPVRVSEPVVSWPAVPGDPRPTALQLTTQRPLDLDLAFGCDTARRAAGTPDGLVLATMAPQSPQFARLGLVASVRGDVLTVTSRGVPLVTRPLPAGPCRVAVHGDLGAVTATVDGAVVGSTPGPALPDVDVLTSSLTAAGGGPVDLAVRVTVDDQFATSPTPLKNVVAVLLVLALVVAVGALAWRDRAVLSALTRGPTPRRWWRAVDLVVPMVMVAWVFLAPMTDDDGYYAAMAGNVPFDGYVANYYQLYNQSFTPFTWIYYALSGWQHWVGSAPVVLRVPALLVGLLTWFALRALVAKAWPGPAPSAWGGRVRRAVLAVAFLAWWLPFDMGVRAEAVVALTSVVSLLCLCVAVERDRWSFAALGVGAAAFGFTAAPTGFVALAPLLAGAPSVWRMLRAHLPVRAALLALLPIVAPGGLVGLLAFGDGSLRDFTRAQQIFLGLQTQESWYSEITRWSFLLAQDDAMANYAKRAPVLVGVAAVVCFLLLVVARRRLGPVPPRFLLAGWSTLLGFALLWFTPSKWTHHFGALAGVGPALVALLVVAGPLLARDSGRDGVRWPPLVGAGVALALVLGLAAHGTNRWPYSWMLGLPHPGTPPQVWIVAFEQPVWWLLGMVLVGGAVVLAARRRPSLAPWRPAAPVVALATATVVFLAVTTVYMVGDFAVGAAVTARTWSPWADAVADPLGHRGVAAAEMEVLDPASAVPLPAVTVAAPSPAFVPGAVFPTSPSPTPAVPTWGSFLTPAGPAGAGGADASVGRFTSPWYALPPASPDRGTAISVSGRTGEGDELRVEYGRPGPGGPEIVASRVVGLGPDEAAVDSTAWRPVLLDGTDGPPPGASVVRVSAVDASTAPGGWLAVTAPSTQRWSALRDFLPADRTVAVTWQFAFLFPGLHKPTQGQGINEPSTAAVMWGTSPLAIDSENVYAIERGGLFAQSVRESSVVQLPTRLRHSPATGAGEVYLFRPYTPAGPDYRLTPTSREVWGFSPAPNTTFSTPVDPG